jgi:glucose/mannose-6-phosphate isomerase
MLMDAYNPAGVGDEVASSIKAYRLIIGCGMGGSDFSLLAVKPLIERIKPFIINRSHNLPLYASTSDLVVAVSYSGETYETLECVRQAVGKGIPAAGVAGNDSTLASLLVSHGYPVALIDNNGLPRASLASLVGALVALLLGKQGYEIINNTIKLLNVSKATSDAERIVARIWNNGAVKIPIFVSCGSLGFTVEQWAMEFAENVKHPALYEIYPESGHNKSAVWLYNREGYLLIYINISVDNLCLIVKDYVNKYRGKIGKVEVLDYSNITKASQLAAILQASLTAGLASLKLAGLLGRKPELTPAIEEYKKFIIRNKILFNKSEYGGYHK